MQIVERIQYPYISVALQTYKVIDRDDDEELMNPFTFRTTKMRTSKSKFLLNGFKSTYACPVAYYFFCIKNVFY